MLDKDLQTALDNYDETGWDGKVSPEDTEAIHHFVLSTVAHVKGITLREAVKLVHMLESGHWSQGWEKGYGAAKRRYDKGSDLPDMTSEYGV